MDYIAPFQMLSSTVKHLQLDNMLFDISDKNKFTHRLTDIKRDLLALEKNEDLNCYLGVVELGISAEVRPKEAGEEQKICKVELVLEGGFSCSTKENETEDHVKRAMMVNGVTALYSIARSIILSVTAQTFSNGGGVVLPMINVVAYCAAEEQAEREASQKDS